MDRLFDIELAREETDRAVARVFASDEWKQVAYKAVLAVCRRLDTFIVDDVWEEMGGENAPMPSEPRAMGAVIRKAAKDGLIVHAGTYTLSARVTCHRNPTTVWKVA